MRSTDNFFKFQEPTTQQFRLCVLGRRSTKSWPNLLKWWICEQNWKCIFAPFLEGGKSLHFYKSPCQGDVIKIFALSVFEIWRGYHADFFVGLPSSLIKRRKVFASYKSLYLVPTLTPLNLMKVA